MVIKTGAIVDATVTESPRKPRGKTTYMIAGDRTEEDRSETDIEKEAAEKHVIKMTQPGVDTQAAWLKKAGKLHYGYKKHI